VSRKGKRIKATSLNVSNTNLTQLQYIELKRADPDSWSIGIAANAALPGFTQKHLSEECELADKFE
jgi:hypothetical protein